jgi:hypothetical protein
VGIICASLPTLKPLISQLFPHFLTSAFTGTDNSAGQSRQNDWGRDFLKTHITGPTQSKSRSLDLESGGMGKIKVRQDVDQVIESHVPNDQTEMGMHSDSSSKKELML